jgi:glycosyltransferase involved in cell wall biosynthesis
MAHDGTRRRNARRRPIGTTRFIFITQVVDPDHPALGATVAKIRALAERVDEVVVLALRAERCSLPSNCRVRTFGARSRLERLLRFEAALVPELQPRPVGVFAHMAPMYAVVAAPLCRPLDVPVLLWFTQWHTSRLLRIAERMSSVVLTVDAGSFPFPSSKVLTIGHGIDTNEFHCSERPDSAGMNFLSLGRYSSVKGLETVIHAAALVPGARLTHYGPALTREEERYRAQLEQLAEKLGGSPRIVLAGPVPRRDVPELLASADALINNTRAGSSDKVVYEAAACCLPVFASNPVFKGFLPEELCFPRDDPAALADSLRRFSALDRVALGHELRQRAASGHSVNTWADRVLESARR